MKPFAYERARDVDHALSLAAASPGARFLAGGTNLLDLMKLEIEQPPRLIDVGRLRLADIAETAGGGLRIGALASNTAVASAPEVRPRAPLLRPDITDHRSRCGNSRPAKGRLKPTGGHETGQLGPDLVLRLFRDCACNRTAASSQDCPSNGRSPEFRETRQRPRIGIEQHFDIGIFQPQVGQWFQRLTGDDRLREEHTIDASRTRPGDDIRQNAQARARCLFDQRQQFPINILAATF